MIINWKINVFFFLVLALLSAVDCNLSHDINSFNYFLCLEVLLKLLHTDSRMEDLAAQINQLRFCNKELVAYHARTRNGTPRVAVEWWSAFTHECLITFLRGEGINTSLVSIINPADKDDYPPPSTVHSFDPEALRIADQVIHDHAASVPPMRNLVAVLAGSDTDNSPCIRFIMRTLDVFAVDDPPLPSRIGGIPVVLELGYTTLALQCPWLDAAEPFPPCLSCGVRIARNDNSLGTLGLVHYRENGIKVGITAAHVIADMPVQSHRPSWDSVCLSDADDNGYRVYRPTQSVYHWLYRPSSRPISCPGTITPVYDWSAPVGVDVGKFTVDQACVTNDHDDPLGTRFWPEELWSRTRDLVEMHCRRRLRETPQLHLTGSPISPGTVVFKIGYRTGFTCARVVSRKAMVQSAVDPQVPFGTFGAGARLRQQVVVSPLSQDMKFNKDYVETSSAVYDGSGKLFADEGDSGSLVWTVREDGDVHAVGILWCIAPRAGLTFVTPMDTCIARLGLTE